MRDVVTKYCSLSLAGPQPRIIPVFVHLPSGNGPTAQWASVTSASGCPAILVTVQAMGSQGQVTLDHHIKGLMYDIIPCSVLILASDWLTTVKYGAVSHV